MKQVARPLRRKIASASLSRILQPLTKNMKLKSVSVVAASLAIVAQVTAGDITGTVTLSGTPPAEKAIAPLKEDPICGQFYKEMPMTRFFVVGANKELADVIVLLKGVPSKAADATVLDQKHCLYSPQIVAVQTGQKLLVRNSDPAPVAMHNVHINPTAEANKAANATAINAVQMAGAADLTYIFPAAENFQKFQCDVHPWMFAWVTVVDSPYFAVSDKDGKFTIKDVPAGKYKIVALHRKAAPTGIEKDVEVTADGAKADFTVEIK
jgi:hypothetical protein